MLVLASIVKDLILVMGGPDIGILCAQIVSMILKFLNKSEDI